MDEFQDRRDIDELARLLDVWGGDARRWPVPVRAEIARLAVGPEAAGLIAQAQALDRALDSVAEIPAAIDAARGVVLADSITAAALAASSSGRAAGRQSGVVVGLRRTEGRLAEARLAEARRADAQRADAREFGGAWSTAALLAASLLVGVYLGGSVNMLPVLQEVAEVVGMSTVVDPAVGVLGDELAEEDAP